MKKIFITIVAVLGVLAGTAQQKYISAAFFTTQNAMPFGKFKTLFHEIVHPGIEFGYGKIISSKTKQEFSLELKVAYFYHRFVQHGIPLYLNYGYRYKISSRFSADIALGAGCMLAIPATDKLKLKENGDYVNNKGIGRIQAIASLALGLNYVIQPTTAHPLRLFTNYQQLLQTPFIKSYVPLLPYNSFKIGLSRPLLKK